MERTLRARSARTAFVWLAVFALVAAYLVQSSRDRSGGPEAPRFLENVRLTQASTLTLLIDGNTSFPTVNLRAIVGPDGCRIGRRVQLERLVAGSTAAVPHGQAQTTGSFGHAVWSPIPNIQGDQYRAVVADDPAGCDGAVSNIVTLPGPG